MANATNPPTTTRRTPASLADERKEGALRGQRAGGEQRRLLDGRAVSPSLARMMRDSLRDRREGVTAPPTPPFPRMLLRAGRLHCCVCGSGGLFTHWTRMVERCPRCRFLFERGEGQFIGAVGINTIVTFGALLVTLVVGFIVTAPDIATVPLLAIGLAIAAVLPIAFYPFSKTVWTAIDLAMTPLEPGEAPGLGAGPAGLAG
jgi:uncharacterized protein (DUF983 family)